MATGSHDASNVALTVSGATGVVTATGIVGTINEYATVIGLSLSAVSIIVALIFNYRTDKWRREQTTKDREALRNEIIDELKRD